jgi:hypothetical protein
MEGNMTKGQMQRAMQTQLDLVAKYMREFETVEPNSKRECQLLKLCLMHSANAQAWAANIARL